MLDEAPPDLVGDLDRDVTGPALGGVESHDADRVVFASEQLADQRLPTGVSSSVSRQARPRRPKFQGRDRRPARCRWARWVGRYA